MSLTTEQRAHVESQLARQTLELTTYDTPIADAVAARVAAKAPIDALNATIAAAQAVIDEQQAIIDQAQADIEPLRTELAQAEYNLRILQNACQVIQDGINTCNLLLAQGNAEE